jgi:protein TonB
VEFSEFIAADRFPEPGHSGRRERLSDAGKGLLASLLLHLGIAVAAVGAIAVDPSENPPPVIDLTLLPPVGIETAAGISSRPSALPQAKRTPPAAHFPASFSPPAEREEARAGPPKESAPPPAASEVSIRQAVPPSGRTDALPGSEPSPAVPGASAFGTSPGGSPAPAAASATPGAGPGGFRLEGGGTNERARYLERNYAYIRETIQRGIPYPSIARKMGWQGEVLVVFRILADGSVRDVRVMQGSGHAVLDRGAVEAVRGASPFPRPPAEAEIITPVVYKLY